MTGRLTFRAMMVGMSLAAAGEARAAVVTLTANADAFVMANAPTFNYGGGGGLSVAGSGQSQGRADTVLRFSPLAISGQVVVSAKLVMSEDAAPTSSIFGVGPGSFDVQLLPTDNWSEGFGRPVSPQIGSGNVITYNWLQSLIVAHPEHALGAFVHAGTESEQTFDLAVDSSLNSAVFGSSDFTLHLAPDASTPSVGTTFYSLNRGNAAQLVLTIAPVPEPASAGLLSASLLLLARRRRG